MRLARGVWILLWPGLTGLPDSLVLLASIGRCHILYDTGSGEPGSIVALASNLASAGVKPWDIVTAIVSHAHVPSSGGARWLHDNHKVTIAARRPDSRWVEEGDPVKTAAVEYGVPPKPVPVGLELSREGRLPGGCEAVEVLFTPGHTPGSVSIQIETREATVLAVSDALGRLRREWASSERDWIESLEKISSRDPDYLCTSVTCMDRKAARAFLEETREKGPFWDVEGRATYG
ncbi:MBL fold metallo-hydrolase [Aeropyrum camini]|uniref:MBL fold metallo-hydrolase n=1 Tax=Aeropyrum camini TaxID=229980 RepID=UPI00130EAE1D|nr:MBL fold metallo-hydrolase [Aeropyrum camini]